MNKSIVLLVFILLSGLISRSQSVSVEIKLDNRIIFQDTSDNKDKIPVLVSISNRKKPRVLEFLFTELETNVWFYRNLQISDIDENQLFNKDSITSVKILLKQLKKLANSRKELQVYSTITPKDKTIAIRMKRQYICTLKLP